jgi:hypothetical protein
MLVVFEVILSEVNVGSYSELFVRIISFDFVKIYLYRLSDFYL